MPASAGRRPGPVARSRRSRSGDRRAAAGWSCGNPGGHLPTIAQIRNALENAASASIYKGSRRPHHRMRPGTTENDLKKILGVHRAPGAPWARDGFPVRSLLGYDGLGRQLSPFLLLDHAAPTRFEPAARPRGVGVHPHRGFETVTIVYQGELEHRDSTGAGGRIGPGDVQWMTAGGGILHEEFHAREFTRAGGVIE